MRPTVISLFIFLQLVACGPTEQTTYHDTANLELPPALLEGKEKPNVSETDDSVVSVKKAKSGLGDSVSLSTSKPLILKIKYDFDRAWNTLEMALKQSEIEITDREHDKGVYYVKYDADSYVPNDETLAGRMLAVFTNNYSEAGYILRVTADDSETQITAALADKSNANDHSEETAENANADGADKLLMLIYEKMRDDFVEE